MPDAPKQEKKSYTITKDMLVGADHKDRELVHKYIAAITGPGDRKKAGQELIRGYNFLPDYLIGKGKPDSVPNPGVAAEMLRSAGVFQDLEKIIEKIAESKDAIDLRDLVQGESINERHPLIPLLGELQKIRAVTYLRFAEDVYQDEKPTGEELAELKKHKNRERIFREIKESYFPKEKEGEQKIETKKKAA